MRKATRIIPIVLLVLLSFTVIIIHILSLRVTTEEEALKIAKEHFYMDPKYYNSDSEERVFDITVTESDDKKYWRVVFSRNDWVNEPGKITLGNRGGFVVQIKKSNRYNVVILLSK